MQEEVSGHGGDSWELLQGEWPHRGHGLHCMRDHESDQAERKIVYMHSASAAGMSAGALHPVSAVAMRCTEPCTSMTACMNLMTRDRTCTGM